MWCFPACQWLRKSLTEPKPIFQQVMNPEFLVFSDFTSFAPFWSSIYLCYSNLFTGLSASTLATPQWFFRLPWVKEPGNHCGVQHRFHHVLLLLLSSSHWKCLELLFTLRVNKDPRLSSGLSRTISYHSLTNWTLKDRCLSFRPFNMSYSFKRPPGLCTCCSFFLEHLSSPPHHLFIALPQSHLPQLLFSFSSTLISWEVSMQSGLIVIGFTSSWIFF